MKIDKHKQWTAEEKAIHKNGGKPLYKGIAHEEVGKIVKRYNEYGIILCDDIYNFKGEPCIRYDNKKEDDCEQLLGLPFIEAPNYILKYINKDGTLKI